MESDFIDRVIVSTEDEEIADIARSFSAEVPFKRPTELAKDTTKGIEPVLHALKNLSNVDNLLLLQPTSPLRKTKHINEIFEITMIDTDKDGKVNISYLDEDEDGKNDVVGHDYDQDGKYDKVEPIKS